MPPRVNQRIGNRDDCNCYVNEHLTGKELKAGERLRVQWPDGSQEIVTTAIEYTTSTELEMSGCYTEHTSQRLIYRTTYHGVKIQVPLVGLRAQRLPRLHRRKVA